MEKWKSSFGLRESEMSVGGGGHLNSHLEGKSSRKRVKTHCKRAQNVALRNTITFGKQAKEAQLSKGD